MFLLLNDSGLLVDDILEGHFGILLLLLFILDDNNDFNFSI